MRSKVLPRNVVYHLDHVAELQQRDGEIGDLMQFLAYHTRSELQFRLTQIRILVLCRSMHQHMSDRGGVEEVQICIGD